MLNGRARSVLLVSFFFASSCTQDMTNQPRYKYLEKSSFFNDGRSARPLEYGVIPRGALDPTLPYMNADRTTFIDKLPLPLTRTMLERGRERYEVYCSPCHGRAGYGDGMVARRGFLGVPSLHSERVRALPAGYIYAVISNGFGAMPDYSYQIPRPDRWAIVAYVRTLQLSQHLQVSDLTPDERLKLEGHVP